MKKIINNKKGFTLIELLAVMVIMVSVGAVITSIIVSALRSGNKSQTINDVRENGNYVLSQMSKMITFSKHLDGLSTGATDAYGNLIYDTNCVLASTTPAPTPAVYKYIKITSFDNGQTVFNCDSTGIGKIASNSVSMINPNFSVTNCSFTCMQADNSVSPTIDINFTLGKNTSSLFSENRVSIPFETSLTLRNFGD